MRILVVDDDRGYLSVLVKFLQDRGDSVTTAVNGEQGLAVYLNEPKKFDAILTDDQMPKMTGMEMVKQIRIHENGFKVPIIILSATVSADKSVYLANDVYAVLTKPVRFTELGGIFKGIESKLASEKTVLYIEDNKINRTLIQQLLEQFEDVHILMAETAEEGIQLAKQAKPKLIFIDINLPGMNGIDALKLLRSNSTLKSTAMVALSGLAMTEQIESGLDAGFDDYITKPVDVNRICALVEGM